jgi:hypothetical protein
LSHVRPTVLAGVTASLSLTSFISNHQVAGSIMVTHHNVRASAPHLFILEGLTISTHSFSHGYAPASISGRVPFLFKVIFVL